MYFLIYLNISVVFNIYNRYKVLKVLNQFKLIIYYGGVMYCLRSPYLHVVSFSSFTGNPPLFAAFISLVQLSSRLLLSLAIMTTSSAYYAVIWTDFSTIVPSVPAQLLRN